MELFKAGGMAIRIHPTLICLLIIYMLLGLAGQVLMLFALLIGHELAHIIRARSLGVRVVAMDISPIGGTAQCEDSFEGNRRVESSIALAGPLFNMFMLLLAQILRWQGLWQGPWVEDFIRINFWLAAFNLLPVLPLDGGRIMRAMTCGLFGFVKTTKVLAWAGRFLGIILAVMALLVWKKTPYGAEPVLYLLLAVFFWLAGKKEIFAARLVFLRQLTRKKEELIHRGLMPVKWLTAEEGTPLVRIVEEFTPDRYTYITLNNSRFAGETTFTEAEIMEGFFQEGIRYTLGQLLE